MLDTIRKTLLTGVGALAVSHERLRTTLDELTRRGDITTEQARALLAAVVDRGRRDGRLLAHQLGAAILRWMERIPFVLRHELDRLESRVRDLESRVCAQAPDLMEPSGPGPDVSGPPEPPGAEPVGASRARTEPGRTEPRRSEPEWPEADGMVSTAGPTDGA